MNSVFNDDKTFETFIEDDSNCLALAASREIAGRKLTYNPLTIYGETGCGKTHLLMAIKAENEKIHHEKKVGYFTTESIVADFLADACKFDYKPNLFGKKCLEYDVILIDEIEDLRGKEATQEATFHLLNRLVGQDKKVVLACSIPLKELPTLSERLLTRFECGLICGISIATPELREKYTARTAKELQLQLSDEVIKCFSENHNKLVSIRGKLLTLKLIAGDEDLTVERIQEIIKEGENENE